MRTDGASTLPDSRRHWHLAAWLLACPALLAVAVAVLPRFDLYGTPAESAWIGALIALPLLGVIGLCRHLRASWPARIALSLVYVLAAMAVAVFCAIVIGCSWAGACF